jgi:hypothetical protein
MSPSENELSCSISQVCDEELTLQSFPSRAQAYANRNNGENLLNRRLSLIIQHKVR